MQLLGRIINNKTRGKSNVVKKDYLDRLGSEQIKKMIERGTQMPVISV